MTKQTTCPLYLMILGDPWYTDKSSPYSCYPRQRFPRPCVPLVLPTVYLMYCLLSAPAKLWGNFCPGVVTHKPTCLYHQMILCDLSDNMSVLSDDISILSDDMSIQSDDMSILSDDTMWKSCQEVCIKGGDLDNSVLMIFNINIRI